MKYFLKYSYYILIGALFAVILSALIGGNMKWELIPIIICNIYIIRLMDDCFDFRKDKKKKKKQILNFNQLIIADTIFCIIYFGLNVAFYGLWGLFSLLLILYMGVENKHETLKMFFASVASIFYIGAYRELDSVPIIVFLCLLVVASVVFYIYKRRGKHHGKI